MKTDSVGQKKNSKTKPTNAMNNKQINEKTNSPDTPTSTQSSESQTSGMRPYKDDCSEEHPFNIINKEGKFIIAIGNDVVCPYEFESEFDAEVYISKRPWQLIMVANAIFYEKVKRITNGND